MPDKSKQLYDLYKSNGLINKTSYDEFSNANDEQKKQLYDLGKNKGLFKQTGYDTFSSAFKKKVPSELKSESSSQGTQEVEKPEPSVSSGSENNLYTYSGRPGVIYKKQGNDWYIDLSGAGQNFKKIDNSQRVATLEREAKPAFRPTEEQFSFEQAPKAQKIKTTDKEAQKVFSESFKALDKKDPIVIAREQKDKKIESALSKVNEAIVGSDEEDAVVKMKNVFKTAGADLDMFDFSEEGIGYDKMRIKNKYTGKYIDVSLDNWTNERDSEEAKLLKGFIDVELRFADQAKKKKEIQDLYKQMESNPAYAAMTQEKIDELQKEVDIDQRLKENYVLQSNNKYLASAVYNKDKVKTIESKLGRATVTSIDIKQRQKEYQDWKDKADAALKSGTITQEEYDTTYLPKLQEEEKSIQDDANKIVSDLNDIRREKSDLDKIAGLYVSSQEDRGNILSGTASALFKGFAAGGMGLPMLSKSLDPNDDTDYAKFMDSIAEGTTIGGTSKEYLTSENRDDFTKAILGIAESFGQVAAGGGEIGGLTLFGASYLNFRSEIDSNPELKNINQYEKVLLSAGLAAPMALLEKFGLDEALSKTPVGSKAVNWILAKTFKSLPKDASKEVLESAIQSNLKAAIAKGFLTATEKGLIEGTTEAVQTDVELGTKAFYNWAKGGDYFETPKTASEWLSSTGESFKLGLIGGAFVNSTIQAANIPLNNMSMKDIEATSKMIQDDNLRDIIKTSLKAKVATGEMSAFEAKNVINNINDIEGVISKIPSDLSDEAKFQSVKLLDEKSRLQQEIAGKDEALVARQKDRINAINEELKNISNAVTQSTEQQQEGTAEGSVSERQRVDEGQQEIGQGEGSKRETEKPSTDTSDSNIPSEETQVIDSFDDVKNANNENDLARLYNEEVSNLSNVNEKEKHIHSSISKVKKDSYVQFGDANNISQGMAKTYFRKDGLSIDQVAQEASQSLTGEFSSDAITPQDVVEYMNKYPNGFNPATPSGNPKLRAISEKYKEITGKQINSRIAKIKANNIGNESKVAAIDSKLTQAIQTAGLLKTLEDNINDEGFWTQFPGGFTKEEYEQIKKEYNETSREELDAIAKPIESRVNWDTENDEISGGAIEQKQEETSFEEIKNLDVTDKTNLQKVQSFLDNALNDLDTFGKETLGMNLPVAVARVVLKTVKTLVDAGVSLEQAFKQAAKQHDVQEVDILDTIETLQNKKKESKASKSAKKISKKENNKVVVNERLALKTQLKLEAKAAKNVAVETRKKQLEVRKELSEMYKKGTITTAQNRVILRKLANVNFLSQKSVDRFLSDYAKVMNNAEYAQKVSDGFKKRRTIKRYLKNNQPTLQTIVKDFLKINPTTVEDVDAYNELADDIVNATKPTKIKDGESDEKVAIEYNSTIDKIGKMIEHQEELAKQRLLDEYNDLVEEGIIDSDMSLSDIKSILESNESTDEETKSALDVAKELLQSKLPSLKGVTDKLMSKVADVDIELLDKKDIIKLAEAIENYLMNGVTDGVGAIMAKYTGKKNSLLAKAKLKATRIEWLINKKNIASRFGFKKKAGEMTTKRALLKWRAENFNSLPIIIERIFKGVTNAAQFTKISGLQAVETGIVAHKKLSSAKEKQFHDKFSKAKMKFGRFNDALNVVERFIYADLSRNAGKTELEANKEFDIAYQNIEKSIESLNKSSIEEDKLKARLYEAALSKIKKGTYAEFLENPGELDPVNIEAVKFAVDSFAEIFPELSRVSLDYYNTELKPEANYASSRFIRNVNPSVDIKEEADYRDEKLVSTKETKPMKAAKRSLIKDGEYIDGTFDTNFFKSYKDSLLAIHTSEARMQLKEFMKDENLREIISDIEDRGMLQRAIANYISDTMGYTREIDDKTLLKITNALNKYAAVRNLGSVASVVKQSIPVALNTLIITGEIPLPLNPLEGVRSDINDWLNRNNISVSQRGEENAVGQQRANKYKAKLQENTASIKNKVGHANELIREYSMKPLAFGDIVSNKLSWIAFYKQSLREQGIDTKNINWDKHELNEDASAYATQMIERAQNPSDFNKMAKFFKDKGQWTNIVKSILIPYSSFNINAKKKMVNDSVTLFSESASDFDKKIAFRSMVGTTAEIASFNAIGLAWRYLVIQAIASSITGDDEEDKGLDREVMYALKNTYSELVSPSPMFNEPTLVATGWAYDKFFRKDQEAIDAENKKREENGEEKMTPEEEKRFLADKIANDPTHEAKGKNFFDSFGSIGTIGKSAYETFELGETINNKYFIDKYKNLKELTPQQIEKLKGIMIVEGLSNLIGIPKDIKSIARTAEKNILYNSLSEAGMRRLNETQEYLGRDLTDAEFKLARKSKNTDNLIYVIDELKGKEKAKEEAFKLLKEGVDIVDFEIMDKLRAGKTAEQIMKEVE